MELLQRSDPHELQDLKSDPTIQSNTAAKRTWRGAFSRKIVEFKLRRAVPTKMMMLIMQWSTPLQMHTTKPTRRVSRNTSLQIEVQKNSQISQRK